MALPAGRVGVRKDSVDWQGNAKGGGGDTYTKQQIDNKFGGLTFRDNEGTPQVKTAEGEWVNFNSGGGFDGFRVPSNLLTLGSVTGDAVDIVSGGFYNDNGTVYMDITVTAKKNIGRYDVLLRDLPYTGNDEYLGILVDFLDGRGYGGVDSSNTTTTLAVSTMGTVINNGVTVRLLAVYKERQV